MTAAPQDAPPPVISDEDKAQIGGLLAMGFGICFGIVASAKGDHWNISKEEAQRLGTAWAEPLGPVLAANSKYVPWAVALLATSGVVMPRLQIDAKVLDAKAITDLALPYLPNVDPNVAKTYVSLVMAVMKNHNVLVVKADYQDYRLHLQYVKEFDWEP
jgi:hypothetical protein